MSGPCAECGKLLPVVYGRTVCYPCLEAVRKGESARRAIERFYNRNR